MGIDPLALMAAREAATAVSGEEGAPHGAGHHALLSACVGLDQSGVTAEPLEALLCDMADTSVVGQFGDVPFWGGGFLSDDDGETVAVGAGATFRGRPLHERIGDADEGLHLAVNRIRGCQGRFRGSVGLLLFGKGEGGFQESRVVGTEPHLEAYHAVSVG
jgi:hypothetical protein